MESFTISSVLNGDVSRLVGVNFEQSPYTITLKLDEVDEWISDQEQMLGIKWIKNKDFSEDENTSRNNRYICHRAGKPRLYISNVPESKKRYNQKPSIKVQCVAYFCV